MTDIPRLIEELEAATEGSIGLDVQVLHACGFGNSNDYPMRDGPTWLLPTRSLEDALQLIGIMQPSMDVEIYVDREAKLATVSLLKPARGADVETGFLGQHRTQAVAACIALVGAVRDMQRRKEAA